MRGESRMQFNIRVLPASPGDCIVVTYTHENRVKNIIIDGGIGETYYGELKDVVKGIAERKEFVDLLVITHVDYDHIEGICRWFEDEEGDKSIVKKIWFNSGTIMKQYFEGIPDSSREIQLVDVDNTKKSISQGISLENKINELGGAGIKVVVADPEGIELDGIKIWVLSPNVKELSKLNVRWEIEEDKNKKMSAKKDYSNKMSDLVLNKFKEDASRVNRSSIALLLEHEGHRILLGGDAVPSVLIESLKAMGYDEKHKIQLDLFKVSHHGSKKNTSEELLKIIDCNNFVISSDASTHGLPNKECFARIISSRNGEANLYFNYPYVKRKRVFLDEDYKDYQFKVYEMEDDTPYQVGEGVLLWR
jgi:metal-dependent hydrolase (beta-lactamase superfamily II)